MQIEHAQSEELYFVDDGEKSYTVTFRLDRNTAYRGVEITDEHGNEITGELKDKIIEAIEQEEGGLIWQDT